MKPIDLTETRRTRTGRLPRPIYIYGIGAVPSFTAAMEALKPISAGRLRNALRFSAYVKGHKVRYMDGRGA